MGGGGGVALSGRLPSSLAERQAGLAQSNDPASLDAGMPHLSTNTPTPDLSQLTSDFSALKFEVPKAPMLCKTRAPDTGSEAHQAAWRG